MTDGAPAAAGDARREIPAWLLTLGLLGLCGSAYLFQADRPGLLEKDEPRYAVTAREMVRSGDWLVPRYNGRERLVKPPGTYWALAASFTASGRFDERSARLPSALAGTLTVLLVAGGAARALGRRAGFAAGAMLATMLLFLGEARLATTDMLFTLFFTAAAGALVPVLEGSPRPGRWILLSGALGGCAALVKTPLGLLLPPIAALLSALLRVRLAGPGALPPALGPGARGRTAAALGGGILLGAGILLAWYLPANGATEGRLRETFGREVAARVGEVHTGPFWFFGPVLLAATVPWTFLLPAGVREAWQRARGPGPGGELAAFALALAAVVLLFFSALPSKLWSYALPVLPPAAVLLAAAGAAWEEDLAGGTARWCRWVGGVGTLALAAAISFSSHVPAVRDAAGASVLEDGAVAVAALAGLLGLAGILALASKPPAALVAGALSVLSLLFTGGPLVSELEDAKCGRQVAEAMREAGLKDGDRLFDVTNHITGVLWYADRTSETKPNGPAPELKGVIEAFAAGERAFAILVHQPEESHPKGEKTQWERVQERVPPGTPPVRVVWRGWGRVAVTNAK